MSIQAHLFGDDEGALHGRAGGNLILPGLELGEVARKDVVVDACPGVPPDPGKGDLGARSRLAGRGDDSLSETHDVGE
jgi:hypothetical protein